MKQTDKPFKFQRVLLIDDNDIDNFINERMITTNSFSQQVVVKNSAEGLSSFSVTMHPIRPCCPR